jgi:glycosyltransferase involved in cell wall biosynthesis
MKFSVLLSLYRGENPDYLNRSLVSIWDEQILRPDQIVLVKDGPLTDELNEIVNKWKENLGELFTVVELPVNIGLGAALNEGLKYCQYDLVARMDTNDVSLPLRFKKQVEYMQNNPEIVASSGIIEEWDNLLEKFMFRRNLPDDTNAVYKFAKMRSPLSHVASIFRKSIILLVGGYPPFYRSQDYALWSLLLSKGYKLSNISDVLCHVRFGNEGMKRRGLSYFKSEWILLKYQYRIHFLNIYEYTRNIITRFIARMLPDIMKMQLYKYIKKS